METKSVVSSLSRAKAKWLGVGLTNGDLGFLQRELPVSEFEQLRRYSQINSHTLNREGVEEMQGLVAERLEKMGFRVQRFANDPRFARLIVAERPGRLGAKFITLITHVDTVLGNDRAFELAGDRAVGSGVIDNKGGVVVGLSALERFLAECPSTEYSLRWICSPNEEMGSVGFTDMFREFADDTVVALGLEPALDDGSIICQRRGNRWYQIDVVGREAHAGRSRGEHANAAHDLAKKIVLLAKLTNYPKNVSVNVGHFVGGKDRYNIICGDAHAKLDVRFDTLEARERLHRKILGILERSMEVSPSGKFRTSTTWEIVDDCPPFSLTKQAKKLANAYSAIAGQLEGRRVFSRPAGGAGDVNYLSAPHSIVLDGLGPVGGEMHTSDEFVSVATLRTRSQALAGLLYRLQGSGL